MRAQHPWGHLHEIHDGHQVCKGDFAAHQEGLVLEKQSLKLIQRRGQPVHHLLQFLWWEWLAREEWDQHLHQREETGHPYQKASQAHLGSGEGISWASSCLLSLETKDPLISPRCGGD